MRGYVEESPEVKARRALLDAARKYAGLYLARPFDSACDQAEADLMMTATDYADAMNPPKRRRTPHPLQKEGKP